jgi:hypothetical protein
MRAMTASGIVPSAIAGEQRIDEHEAGHRRDVVLDRDAAGDRRPAEPDREGEDQQQAPPEDRHRVAGERCAHHRVVPGGVALHRGDDSGGKADRQGEQHGDERQLERGREARREFGEDRLVRDRRQTEVAVQCLPDVVTVLHRQRSVEPELVEQPLVALLGHAALARKGFDRIAGNEADQREDEQRDAEEGRHDEGDAPEEEGKHAAGRAGPVPATGR